MSRLTHLGALSLDDLLAGLVTCEATGGLAAGKPLPSRILMLGWGANDTTIGPMTIGMKSLQASKLWDGLGYGRVAIDFNHNTVPGHASYRGEPYCR